MKNINCDYILTIFKKVTDDKYIYHGLALANKINDDYKIIESSDTNLNGIIMLGKSEVDDGFLFYEIKELTEFVFFKKEKQFYESQYSRLGYTPNEVIRSLDFNYKNKVLFGNNHGEFRIRDANKIDDLNISEKWKKIINDSIIEYNDRKEIEASSGGKVKRAIKKWKINC